jgi:hypothetical protein
MSDRGLCALGMALSIFGIICSVTALLLQLL